MAPQFEAQQIRAFGKIIRNGHLYKGVKPVYWCLDCRSALAEAEVEYEDKTSPAIDVAFNVVDNRDFEQSRGHRERQARRCAHRRRHLDHDSVDASGEPGGRASRRVPLRARESGVGR